VNLDIHLTTIRDLGLKGLSEEAKNAAGKDNIEEMAKGSTNKLLSNCYVCVNRYNYISADEYKGVTLAAAKVAASFMPGLAQTLFLKGTEVAVAKIQGYFVKVNSYLFKLEWNDELRQKVETEYWKDDPAVQQKLLQDDAFKLVYVGKSSKNAPAALTFKASALDKLIERGTIRATDRAFAALQRDYEEFRPMASLQEMNGKLIAYIGMKEDVKSGDKFEVFKPEINPDGTLKEWKEVGTIKVNKGCVWDNRAGAGEVIEGEAVDKKEKDDEEGGKMEWTEFKDKPSKNVYGGLMIRMAK